MSLRSLIERGGQAATIYRDSPVFDDAGLSTKTQVVIASDVRCLVQVSKVGFQQLARGQIATRGYRGYFLVDDAALIQAGDLVRIVDKNNDISYYRVVRGIKSKVTPPSNIMAVVELEWDVDHVLSAS